MVHGRPTWVGNYPELGLPDSFQAAVISTQAVCMNNSKLVFSCGTLVHGGGFDGIRDDPPKGSRYVEQLITASTHRRDQPLPHASDTQRTTAWVQNRLHGGY